MIDTLKLNITDCQIDSTTQLVIEPSPYLHDSQMRFISYDLFVDSEGECVQGKKAYLNTDKFNVTIKPKYSLHHDSISKKTITGKYVDGLKINEIRKVEIPSEDFNAGIFVQTSLPRYLNTNNFSALSMKDEKRVLKQLEKDLWNEGIKTNIWNAYLSRIDMFANLNTDENFTNYTGVFDLLDLSRMKKFEYAGTTFLYRNGEQQICIYDKLIEMQNKSKDFKITKSLPPNVMRIENRLLKKRKIFSVSGINQLHKLYNNYDFIKDYYKKEVGENVFNHEPEDVRIVFCYEWKKILNYFKEYRGREFFNYMFQAIGLNSVLEKDSIENLFIAIDELEINKMRKSRLRKKTSDLMKDIKYGIIPNINTKTNLQLYRELKTKFYKAVA